MSETPGLIQMGPNFWIIEPQRPTPMDEMWQRVWAAEAMTCQHDPRAVAIGEGVLTIAHACGLEETR